MTPTPAAGPVSPGWRVVGGVVCLVFLAMAAVVARGPDPVLSVILYLAAATTAGTIARGRPVQRWVNVVLVVLPAELCLMTLLFEAPEQRALAVTATDVLTRRAALAALGMLVIATWSAVLAVARPHQDGTMPEL